MIQYVLAESEWELARLGKFTASKIDALFTVPRSKEDRVAGLLSRSAKNYIESRAAEIVTGYYQSYELPSMEWGTRAEPEAAARISEIFPNMEYYGKKNSIFLPYTDRSGGSPDEIDLTEGLVGEIKCPYSPAMHLKYCMLESDLELKAWFRKIWHQLQMNMVCTSMKYNIDFKHLGGLFFSYSPHVRRQYKDLFILPVRPCMEFYEGLSPVITKAEQGLAKVIEFMTVNRPQLKAA